MHIYVYAYIYAYIKYEGMYSAGSGHFAIVHISQGCPAAELKKENWTSSKSLQKWGGAGEIFFF
jgi:hypothetical protein